MRGGAVERKQVSASPEARRQPDSPEASCLPMSFRILPDEIKPASAKRIATQNAPHGKSQSAERSPFRKRVDRILRAARIKAAARAPFQRRQIFAIQSDQIYEKLFDHGTGSPAFNAAVRTAFPQASESSSGKRVPFPQTAAARTALPSGHAPPHRLFSVRRRPARP